MVEKWLRERQAQEQALYSRAQRTRSQQDIAAWERFARQTARMRVTADQLRGALPPEYAVQSGIRVLFQGREIYLEHLVAGPSGIYLVESVEDNPQWRDDLARSLAFFNQNLGSNIRYFSCLVVARDLAGTDRLPQGVHLMESLEAALYVIREAPVTDPMPPSVAQELWHIIRALSPRVPVQAPVRAASRDRRFTWREWVTIACAAAANLLLMTQPGMSLGHFIIGLFVIVGPAAGLAGLTLLLPAGEPRTIASWVLMVLAVLFLLLMVPGLFV